MYLRILAKKVRKLNILYCTIVRIFGNYTLFSHNAADFKKIKNIFFMYNSYK